MTTRGLIVAIGVALAAGFPASAAGQSTCTASPSPCSTGNTALPITITIGRAFALGVSPGSTALSAPTAAAFNTGYAQTTGPTATVRSNTPWTLHISANRSTWTGVDTQSEPAWKTKPASELRWSTTAGGTFAAMTTSAVSIRTGTATGGTAVPLFFRTTYGWTRDTPGNYSIQLVFTTTAP